ncbi:MAG TPA: HAD family hydrolase [Anaeromyxobacteraceae bacterium]|nr:HAD family hydrolase [Anaeromyxobacteraceae bacterium]
MTAPRTRVFLFDVDGTLVHAGGAGRRAFERAVVDFCGPLDGALAGLRLDGMTDRLIVRESLAILGRPFEEAFCDRILARYVEHLTTEVHGPGYRVLPGVVAALERLRARGDVLGLCTGNVVEGARLKLSRGGLDGFFDWDASAVCGFAHDGEERERLVLAALARAAARLGHPFDPREALVIGDTPRDVAAAHHAGVPVLAVATGHYSVEELRACGADHAVPTLEDPAAARLLGAAPA